jgi:DNA polymerase elongation subunit (family B)
MSVKLLLNSLYGAMGNAYFRYFDLRIAEAITLTGQMVIQWAERAVNAKMNSLLKTKAIDYTVAIDTDSLYVNFGPLVNKFNPKSPVDFLDKVCEETFGQALEVSYAELFDRFNCYEARMEMKRESIADRGIWTAKKRYILNVHDNEGVRYAVPELKIMGIEAIKSSTPSVCRDALKQLFKVIISGSEANTQKAISSFKEYFCSLPPEQVSFPRGVSDVDKWTDKNTIFKSGCPIHVRGAITYNNAVLSAGLNKRNDLIRNGDKVKFCYLKLPNTVRQNVISYIGYLPPELKLHKYIDYETQFEKAFLKPILPILDAVGWRHENSVSLEDFFS